MPKYTSIFSKKDMSKLEEQGLCTEELLIQLAWLGAELAQTATLASVAHDKKSAVYKVLAPLHAASDLFVQTGLLEGRFEAAAYKDLLEGEIEKIIRQSEDCGNITFMPEDGDDYY